MGIIRYIVRFIIYTKKELINTIRLLKINNNKKFEAQRLKSKSIKLCHSIEKGLALQNPNQGFGTQKIKNILMNLEIYKKNNYNMHDKAIHIIYGVLLKYIEFQQNENIDISNIVNKFNNIFNKIDFTNTDIQGGSLKLSDINISNNEKEAFFRVISTRHSLRDYTDEDIPLEVIKEAVTMALKAPSACNRQPSRVYVVDKSYRKELTEFLSGTGGFENNANKYLIITSDISAFELQEKNQWILSTGIFIGYLSLTLHSKGIGACIIERQLEATKKNKNFTKAFGIPDEEQIICAICIGKYPPEFNVPVSKRYDTDYIFKEINLIS